MIGFCMIATLAFNELTYIVLILGNSPFLNKSPVAILAKYCTKTVSCNLIGMENRGIPSFPKKDFTEAFRGITTRE